MLDTFIGVCKRNISNILIFGIFTLFFGFLLITGEPIYVGDTFQYENQMVTREPVYALLIQIFRFISPDNYYRILIIFQNVLAVAANTAFIVIIREKFSLNFPVSLICVLIQLAPHIMTPVFASTHMVITNSLMTEGILFSIYPLTFTSLICALWSGKVFGKESIVTLALFLMISLIRGQMMVLFVVWFIVMFGVLLFKHGGIKRAVGLFMIFASVFMVRTAVVRVYNYCESGLFADTASGKAMSFANVLYVADREDAQAIKDEGLRELFYKIYDAADAGKMNYKYAAKGIINRAEYHERCHDELNFDYFNEISREYIGETKGLYADRYEELMIALDDVAKELSSYLMPRVIFKYIKNYISVIALGFVRTVAYEHPVLVWYSVVIYIAAVALTILLWRKDPKSKAASFMAVVLLTIVGNVCATALMIQCISRYMIYNMPLFYIAGLLELIELAGSHKGNIQMTAEERGKNGGENGIQKSEV